MQLAPNSTWSRAQRDSRSGLELRENALREARRPGTEIHESLRSTYQALQRFLPQPGRWQLPKPGCFVQGPSGATAAVRLPAPLRVSLPCRATQLILRTVGDRSWRTIIERIFARSRFDEPGRFVTEERDGLPCIAGSDGQLFGHLMGLAHELGHCLYEERWGFHGMARLLRSEASAFLIEDALVRAALPALATERDSERAATAWSLYRGRSDHVTFFFSDLEADDVFAATPRSALAQAFLASRPGYLESIGRQWVYAFAAAQRRTAPVRGRGLTVALDWVGHGWRRV